MADLTLLQREARRTLEGALAYTEAQAQAAALKLDADSEETYAMAGNLIYAARHNFKKQFQEVQP